MGFTDPNYWKQSPPPQTGDMNNERYLNQKAVLELPGAQAPQELTVADGRISPTRSAIVVDTEGGGAADDLEVINTAVGSGTETLHSGMLITLRAKDPARVVTVKNSAAANGINTADGEDIVLSTAWELTLRLVGGRWYEVPGRASAQAAEAQSAAEAALARTAPATTTSRGIGKVATLADMGPDAVIEDGPAFLAAGSDALNALVPTFLIGSIISTYAADGYVPNGCVLPDGAEYTQSQFPSLYTDYLVAGKIVTCTYTEFDAQVALTGNCGKFALDTVNQKFKVPLLKDGDSITHAASVGKIGKSVKAGLPEISANGFLCVDGANRYSGALGTPSVWGNSGTLFGGSGGGIIQWKNEITGQAQFRASRESGVYGNSNTVTTEGIRLRHFVVLASAQNNSSMFDWSNYMAALAGKANSDLSNLEPAADTIIRNAMKPKVLGSRNTEGAWTITGVTPGLEVRLYYAGAASQSCSFTPTSGILYPSAPFGVGVYNYGPGYASILPSSSTIILTGGSFEAGEIVYAYQ